MKTKKANQKSESRNRKLEADALTYGTQPPALVPSIAPTEHDCCLCGLSADQIAQKLRHAERILSRRKDRAKAARALVCIRTGVAMFDKIGGAE